MSPFGEPSPFPDRCGTIPLSSAVESECSAGYLQLLVGKNPEFMCFVEQSRDCSGDLRASQT